MGMNESVYLDYGSPCTWTNDTWCDQNPTDTWCQNFGGWCDHESFVASNCWMYQSSSTECNNQDNCNWHTDEWSQPHCEINWSANCWNYYSSGDCIAHSDCVWNSNGWCTHFLDQCWQSGVNTQAACEAITSGGSQICTWSSWNQKAFVWSGSWRDSRRGLS